MPAPRPLPPLLADAPFATREALAQGVSANRLRRRDLEAPFRGVRVPTSIPLDLEVRVRALLARLPPVAVVWGPTAARLWGVPLPRALEDSIRVHVAVPEPMTAPVGRGIRGHSVSLPLGDRTIRDDLPLTTPARTWLDLARVLRVDQLVVAGDFFIHWREPLVTRSDLESAVVRSARRRGIRSLREALPLLDSRSESPRESATRVTLARAGITGLVSNLPVTTSGGFHYRLDLALPRLRIAIEYQGGYHFVAEQAERDMTRRSRLAADGWIVIEVHRGDLDDPAELVQRVLAAIATRS